MLIFTMFQITQKKNGYENEKTKNLEKFCNIAALKQTPFPHFCLPGFVPFGTSRSSSSDSFSLSSSGSENSAFADFLPVFAFRDVERCWQSSLSSIGSCFIFASAEIKSPIIKCLLSICKNLNSFLSNNFWSLYFTLFCFCLFFTGQFWRAGKMAVNLCLFQAGRLLFTNNLHIICCGTLFPNIFLLRRALLFHLFVQFSCELDKKIINLSKNYPLFPLQQNPWARGCLQHFHHRYWRAANRFPWSGLQKIYKIQIKSTEE